MLAILPRTGVNGRHLGPESPPRQSPILGYIGSEVIRFQDALGAFLLQKLGLFSLKQC